MEIEMTAYTDQQFEDFLAWFTPRRNPNFGYSPGLWIFKPHWRWVLDEHDWTKSRTIEINGRLMRHGCKETYTFPPIEGAE